MPRRSFSTDVAGADATMSQAKVQRKTERSHEENQERAYIAASRRADRSIEARVQSARMASEIHKKRTGKGFRITEDIVTKEEMYEEEDDDLPRSYRLLGPHVQTASPEMNAKVEAYLANRVAMSALLAKTNDEWRENEINKLFAQSFPNANQHARRLSQSVSSPSFYQQHQSPTSPTYQPVTFGQESQHQAGQSNLTRNDYVSPPAMTRNSNSATPTATTQTTPSFDQTMLPASPSSLSQSTSAFTTELPPEAKMFMGGMGMNETFSQPQDWYSQEWSDAGMSFLNDNYGDGDMMKPSTQHKADYNYNNELLDWDPLSQPPTSDDSWKTFLNDNAWANEGTEEN